MFNVMSCHCLDGLLCVFVCTHQERGVGSSDCAVRFNKGRSQFGHLFHGGRTDAVVLGHDVTTWKNPSNRQVQQYFVLSLYFCYSYG